MLEDIETAFAKTLEKKKKLQAKNPTPNQIAVHIWEQNKKSFFGYSRIQKVYYSYFP